MPEGLELLRNRRSGERIEFGQLAASLEAYARAHPQHRQLVEHLATYLSFVQTDDQAALDEAVEETFPASDPPVHSDPISTS